MFTYGTRQGGLPVKNFAIAHPPRCLVGQTTNAVFASGG